MAMSFSLRIRTSVWLSVDGRKHPRLARDLNLADVSGST
jgi:hypothetical protein